MKCLYFFLFLFLFPLTLLQAADDAVTRNSNYSAHVRDCLDTLMQHGKDTYGELHTPLLVSILDTETLRCPADPDALDESFRVVRRGRRNPAAADLEAVR